MVDPVTRTAARAATLAALPITLLVGALILWNAGAFRGTPPPKPQASGPVAVSVPPLSGTTADVCGALLAQVPAALRDRARRPVTAGQGQAAAYGDPPIVLSCGISAPNVPKEDLVYTVADVCWWPAERGDETVWTTVDRQVPVQVTMPKSYQSQGEWIAGFSPAITSAVPASGSKPSGC